MYLSALNINETINLKENGSGTLTISYSATDADIKAKNSLIGNFPFTKEKIDEYFKSGATVVYSSIIEKHPKITGSTQVTVTLGFNNIAKLSDMKVFSDVKSTLTETDSGAVYRCVFPQSFIKTNSLDNIYVVMGNEKNLVSTNGKKQNDKGVMWFRGKEYIDGKSDIAFTATFESSNPVSKNNGKGEEGDGKCGLFGLELPLIMLAGLVFSFNSRKKRSKV